MKSRIKDLYLDMGRVLNNPEAYGLGERAPKPLVDALTRFQLELVEELREQGFENDFLTQELSQDADRHALSGVTATSFTLPERKR
jgi:hypothetical protein